MKKALSIALLLLPFLASSQAIDTSTAEGKARYWNRQIGAYRILSMPDRTLSRAVNALRYMSAMRTPYLTMKDLRSGKADTARVVHIADFGREGMFIYNPSNTTMADDSAMIVRVGNKRYERQYSGAVNARWFGITGNGVTNETRLWQKMIDDPTIKTIYFPKPAVSYRINKLILKSNKAFVFEDGTQIKGLGLLKDGERMFRIYDVENISFTGTNVVISDVKVNYTTGEQRHIFLIQGSKNIRIEGISANDSGSDGFYVGASPQNPYSENVILRDCIADNNRRQGMSIISVVNMLVENCIFRNTKGIAPSAGIDLEPNSVTDRYQNLRFINCKTENNDGDGMLVLFSNNTGSIYPVDIVIENMISVGSETALQFANCRGKLGGEIMVKNFHSQNSKSNGIRVRNWSANGPRISVQNSTVSNPNHLNGFSDSGFGAGVYIFRESTDVSDTLIGNAHFYNLKIEDTKALPFIKGGFSMGSTTVPIVNCSLINPMSFQGVPATTLARIYGGGILVQDDYNVLSEQVTGALPGGSTLSISSYRHLYHNQGQGSERQVVLNNMGRYWKADLVFEVRSPQYLRIKPNAANAIYPLSAVGGKYIRSNVIGSRIVLNWDAANAGWTVKSMVGTWEVEP